MYTQPEHCTSTDHALLKTDHALLKTDHALLKTVIACFVLPVTLNVFAYYGYVTNYTRWVFTSAGFHKQYDHGIYRYRILGKSLLLLVYDLLERFHPQPNEQSRTTQLLETSNLTLYTSYFLLNTLFFCLTLWTLSLIFQSSLCRLRNPEKTLALLVTAFLIAMTQFVVVPYDTLAYFLLTLSIFLMLRPPSRMRTAGLLGVMVLSALTRETAFLTLSLSAALYGLRGQVKTDLPLPLLAGLAAAFAGTYIGLRLCFGWDQGVGNDITIAANLSLLGLIGAAFLASVIFLLTEAGSALTKHAMLLFLLLSSPYLFSILLMGVLFEARLYIPLFLGILVLSSLTARAEPDFDA